MAPFSKDAQQTDKPYPNNNVKEGPHLPAVDIGSSWWTRGGSVSLKCPDVIFKMPWRHSDAEPRMTSCARKERNQTYHIIYNIQPWFLAAPLQLWCVCVHHQRCIQRIGMQQGCWERCVWKRALSQRQTSLDTERHRERERAQERER